jgi:hypothetical protein
MSRRLLIGTLTAGAGILALVFGLDRPKVIYSVSVSEFLSRNLWDRPLHVQGVLVHGTLCRVDSECGYRFRLANQPSFGENHVGHSGSSEELSVSYDGCAIPDTFRDVAGMDLQISVEGERCRGCHDFKATQVIARGGSGKYELSKHDPTRSGPSQPLPRCAARMPSR